MSAADALAAAGNLVARFGHDHRTGIGGDELSGFTIPGAVARTVADQVDLPGANEFALMRGWVIERAALSYVVAVLGYDPDNLSPHEARDRVARAADGVRLAGMGTGWAVAVLDAARELAAAAEPRTPGAALVERTRHLTLLALPGDLVA